MYLLFTQELAIGIGQRQLSPLKFYSKFNTKSKTLKKKAFAIFSFSTQRKKIPPHIKSLHIN